MCIKDPWYVFTEGLCFNSLAHVTLCGVLIGLSVLCIVKGVLVLPQLVPRAKRILGLYIATQISAILIEIFGLVVLKTDSSALRLFRWFVFASFALLQYWSSILRTEFFLETVANTQQYNVGRWTSIMKLCLIVILSIYSTLAYILLMILPGTLPTATQREISVRVGVSLGSVLYFSALVPTALVGNRLLAVIRTVIELGHAQPARVEIAKENMVILRQGMFKTILALGLGVVVLFIAAIIGLTWVILHLIIIATQIGFVGATSYLQTCKTVESRDRSRTKSKSKQTHSKLGEKSAHTHTNPKPSSTADRAKSRGKSMRMEHPGKISVDYGGKFNIDSPYTPNAKLSIDNYQPHIEQPEQPIVDQVEKHNVAQGEQAQHRSHHTVDIVHVSESLHSSTTESSWNPTSSNPDQ